MATPVTSSKSPSKGFLRISRSVDVAGPHDKLQTLVTVTGSVFEIWNNTTKIFGVNGDASVALGAISCTTLSASGSISTAANLPLAYLSATINNVAANGYAQLNFGSGTALGSINFATGLFYKFYHNGALPWQWESGSGVVASLTAAGAATFAAGVSCTTLTASDQLTVTRANAVITASLVGATGKLNIYAYNDAVNGAIINAYNTAESAFIPLTIQASSFRLSQSTASVSAVTGALVVTGGVGVSGAINCAAGVSCTTLTATSGSSSVAGIVTVGGAGTQGRIDFGTAIEYGIKAGADYLGMLFTVNGAQRLGIDTNGAATFAAGVSCTTLTASETFSHRLTLDHASVYTKPSVLLETNANVTTLGMNIYYDSGYKRSRTGGASSISSDTTNALSNGYGTLLFQVTGTGAADSVVTFVDVLKLSTTGATFAAGVSCTTLTASGNITAINASAPLIVYADGIASGSGGGAAFYGRNGGVGNSIFGNWSAILGGAYDATTLLWGASGVKIIANGGATAQVTIAASGAATFSAGVSCTTLTASSSVTVGTGANQMVVYANGGNSGSNSGGAFYAQAGGATKCAFGVASAILGGVYDARPYIWTAGAGLTCDAGVTCTTLTASGDNEISLTQARTGTPTGSILHKLTNSGGDAYIGLESSVGNRIFGGTAVPYAMGITTVGTRDLLLGTNNTIRLRFDGTTGAATFAAGVTCTTLTVTASIEGPKVKLTPEGGIATLMVADEAIAIGSVCSSIQGGTANRVKKTPISGNENDMPIGVAYSAAAAAGSTFWMVVTGRVGVLPDAGVTAVQGYIITTSATTAGLVAQAAVAPAAATHFEECGHFLTAGTGAGVITDAIVHFN